MPVNDSTIRFLQEAQALSSLVPFLDEHGVNLYAVVHEVLGTEEFKAFFSGEVFLDPEVSVTFMKFLLLNNRLIELGISIVIAGVM